MKKPKKKQVSYQINPMNYVILSEQEKIAVLRQFTTIMLAIEKKVRITIINQIINTDYAGEHYSYAEKMVYFTSKQDLGSELFGTGFKSVRLDEPLEFKVKAERMKHMEMESGEVYRAYNVHSFSRGITPAWINQLSSICSMINIDISPMKPGAARRALLTHANTLDGRLGLRAKEEAAQAREVNDLLQKQMTSVFDVGITAIVSAPDEKTLKKNCREFERNARWRQISCLAIGGVQKEVLDGRGPKFLFEANSVTAFYPFESSDLIEADGAGGVYLGTNDLTGTPVIYDYLRRTNYNMIVLGASGFGKSVAAKTYIDNFYHMMKSRYPNQPFKSYILDLHGEYVQLAKYLNMDVMDLMARDEMGLDPFALLQTSDAAVDLLAEVSKMPPKLKSITLSMAHGVKSVAEMVQRLESDTTAKAADCQQAAEFLSQFVGGDLAAMFKGELKIKDRTIISLRKATESDTNSMLISLALQKIWRDIRDAPRHEAKLIVIEEAWFVLRLPETAAILSNIARSGRKENCHLLVMTQDIDEVLGNEHGKAVIKNSATLLMLGLKPATVESLKQILDLSDKECNEIKNLAKGNAIMRADRNRIKLQIKPTADQLKQFDTAATGFVPTGQDA